MYKTDWISLILLFFVSALILFFLNLDYCETFYSNCITYLSISFGFLLTSISILFNSEYIKRYYKIKDGQDKKITKLNRLGRYYKIQIYYSICLIMYYLVLDILCKNNTLYKNLEFLNIPLLLCNCFSTYILIKFFLKLFVLPHTNK